MGQLLSVMGAQATYTSHPIDHVVVDVSSLDRGDKHGSNL